MSRTDVDDPVADICKSIRIGPYICANLAHIWSKFDAYMCVNRGNICVIFSQVP